MADSLIANTPLRCASPKNPTNTFRAAFSSTISTFKRSIWGACVFEVAGDEALSFSKLFSFSLILSALQGVNC